MGALRRAGPIALALLAALAGAGALALATRWGPGLTPDGVVYLEAARSLAAGRGLEAGGPDGEPAPLAHFPPLHPLTLAVPIALGAEPEAAARGLGIALLAANVLLVAVAAGAAAPRTRALPALAALLAACSLPLLRVHASVLSEPLFLLLTGAGLLALGRFVQAPGRARLVAAAILLSLAPLVRYAGLALVPVGALAVALPSGPPRARLARAALFSGVALAPLGLWLLRNRLAAGATTGRVLGLHPVAPSELARGVQTLGAWLLLPPLPAPIAAALLGLLAAGLAFAVGRAPGMRWSAGRMARRLGPVASVFALFGLAYVLLLLAATSFVDAHTPLNSRILSPLLLTALVVAPAAAARGVGASSRRRALVGVLAVLLVAGHAGRSARWVRASHRDGVAPGFGTRAWRQSPTLEHVAALARERPVYSNAADAVRVLTGRSARPLPGRWDPVGRGWREDFPQQLRALRRDLERGGGVVVWLEDVGWRPYLMDRADLEVLPLRSLGRYADGELLESR